MKIRSLLDDPVIDIYKLEIIAFRGIRVDEDLESFIRQEPERLCVIQRHFLLLLVIFKH